MSTQPQQKPDERPKAEPTLRDLARGLDSRERVARAIRSEAADRTPVDFLAVPEVWAKLQRRLGIGTRRIDGAHFFDPSWEAVLAELHVDCRVVSYDMFCSPPQKTFPPGSAIDWWGSLSRSTPNRMFRLRLVDGGWQDVWGNRYRNSPHGSGAYEELDRPALAECSSLADIQGFGWPHADWWDLSAIPCCVEQLDQGQRRHIRFRVGSVFETAWHMRGMEAFLLDMAMQPDIAHYILERIAEIHLCNTKAVMGLLGDRLDMLYFYDDVASQTSLLLSKDMWREYVRPPHAALVELAHSRGIPVMYHCDGALYPLLPDLVELGIDVINPIQLDAIGAPPEKLKAEFGDSLAFHGGLDIMQLLPHGTPDEVRAEVRRLIDLFSPGYILCSSHHVQADTPVENILAAYETSLR